MGRERGVSVRGDSIRISFNYRGVRCRETLGLQPTKANRKHAAALQRRIRDEITLGTFDYAKYFPDSPRAHLFDERRQAKQTIAKALQTWLTAHSVNLTAGTERTYRKAITRHLAPRVGDLAVEAFSAAHGRALVAELAEEVSPKSVNNTLIPLRRMFAQLVLDEQLERDPLANVPSLRVTKDDPDPFTPDEARRVLEAIREPQVRHYFTVAFWTGLRASELIALQWGDVDLKAGYLRVRRAVVAREDKGPKTTAGRRDVKLLPEAAAALKAQEAHTKMKGRRVFNNPNTGRPWPSDKAVRETFWNPAVRRAGVRTRPPAQCRHSYASWLLSAGENPAWVARQMGHVNPAFTFRVYARWIPDVDPAAGEKAAAIWKTA